jgi:hypothetical protein
MASEPIFIFRRPADPAQRPGMALLASALLHGLMVMSWAKQRDKQRQTKQTKGDVGRFLI